MPAANERALEKAKTIPADAIIFDLEDAVAPDAKPAARDQACAAAASGEYGRREITIRCNGLDTAWGADDLARRGDERGRGSRDPEGRLDRSTSTPCPPSSTPPARRRRCGSGR